MPPCCPQCALFKAVTQLLLGSCLFQHTKLHYLIFDLQGFVKIAKWNDYNFWAMKQAADKSHHTLHKFVRKYEVTDKLNGVHKT